MNTLKEEAHQLVDRLPEGATWDDLMYQIYVRQKIAAGLQDLEEDRVVSHEEVKRRFGQ